jgi:Divergent InlB B-repeat domain
MKIATLAIGLVIRTLVMAAAISSPLAIAAPIIKTGPYASNLTPTSDHSLGLKQVLFIRTQFPDLATSKTQADCQTVMEQVRQRYVRSSYGRTDMNVTVTAVAYMMPHPSSYYVTQRNTDAIWTALMNDAVAAASADYPVDQTGGSYDFVGDYFPYIAPAPGHPGSGTFGSMGTKWFWISGGGTFQGLYPGLIVHEMGHAYGAGHADLWQTSDGNPVSATGKIVKYSDTYDSMGGATGYTQPYGDFNPKVKWQFGWIDDAQVSIVTAPGIYQFRIFRFDSAAATGLLAIKIPRGDGSNYWIGIRRNWVKKPLEMTGAYIIWGYDVLAHDSALIDCNTPGSNIADSALQVGQTLNDAPHRITITPLAIGGSDPHQYMDVQVTKQPTTQVTVQTNPAGLTFTVDGGTYAAAQTFSWDPGSSHTIATTSPQSGGTGVRYVWKNWSGGGAISHSVAPTTNKTYTANFGTQYYLTMAHGTGGTVTPASGWKNSGVAVSITAMPATGYSFTNWTGSGTGSFSGTNNPASITMNGPITETAAFTHN